MIDEARWWSWRRQRLDRTARGIDDALRSVIAISGAHPTTPLALLARVPRLLQGMYEGSSRSRTAIRLPAMRKAVWMLAAETAHVPFHACRGTGVIERNLLRRVGLGPDHWNELREKVLALCATPMQSRDIKEAAGGDAEQLHAVLTVLAANGEIVRHRAPSLTSNAFTFIATESWLGREIPAMPPDDALTFLAGDYLQAYGPVTVADFAWWTGLPPQKCELALYAHEPVRLDAEYLLWAAHARAFEQFRPVSNRVNLLPAWDPYPMGYIDRSRLGAPEVMEQVFDKTGSSLPIVLVEGAVAGTWEFNLTRANNLSVTVTMFESPSARVWEAIEAECGAIGTLFQARDLTVTRAPVPRRRARHATAATETTAAARTASPARKVAAPSKAPARKVAARSKAPARKAAARTASRARKVAARSKAPARKTSPARKVAAPRKAVVGRKRSAARKTSPARKVAAPRKAKPARNRATSRKKTKTARAGSRAAKR